MNKSENISELAKALSLFQKQVKQPKKDKTNPFFKSTYVDLSGVVEAITQVAPDYGLSFLQYPVSQESNIGIVTVLMHESGQYIETEPIYVKPTKNDPQAAGSAVTYLKRYSLSAVFGITSDVDDDGNKASEKVKRDLATTLKEVSDKVGIGQKDLYETTCHSLNISKQTKDLTEKEKNAIIAVLLTK